MATICAAARTVCAAIIVKSDVNSDPPVNAVTEGSAWATGAASASMVMRDATVDVVSAQGQISLRQLHFSYISALFFVTAGIPSRRAH